VKYTIRQYWRRLQGRCLRCGLTKEETYNLKGTFIFVTCDTGWVRHSWKMR